MLIPFRPRGIPNQDDAHDARLERITNQIRAYRIRCRALSFEVFELARQFVEDDLAGPHVAQPTQSLGEDLRKQRMKELGSVHREYWLYRDKESELLALLASLGSEQGDQILNKLTAERNQERSRPSADSDAID